MLHLRPSYLGFRSVAATLFFSLLCSTALVTAESSAAAEIESNLRGPIFNATEAALKRANAARAPILSPRRYAKGAELYRKAESVFTDGGKLDRIQKLLAEAAEEFAAATVISESSGQTLSTPFQARRDAIEAGAEAAAPKLWEDAEEDFIEAVTRLEAGRERGVDRYAERAEAGYREAELAAIEVSLFTEIGQSIERARDADAEDYAPESLARAEQLLAEARSELASDRYDTDRPRDLANQALHDARRAEYVSALAAAQRRASGTIERELLKWQESARSIASTLDQAVYFDDGPSAAEAEVLDAIADLQKELMRARSDYDQARDHIAALDQEMIQLQAELGGESRARERLNAELERQQRQRERIQRVEALFAPGEAEVFRSQDRLIIRLLGLNFASGKSELTDEHGEILAKTLNAIAEFAQAPIIVEGHTDSFGADLTNLELSKERANSVIEYLVENAGVSSTNLSGVGYGETQPIANNETREGRRKNRRIDLVLYPQW